MSNILSRVLNIAMIIDKDSMELIKTARKYGLRVGSLKCDIFHYFDQGYKPSEVKFIYRRLLGDDDAALNRSISRYYYTWKKAQQQ
ncbi:hypothetical protein ACFLXU_00290 [Chloroflexota bacterium]